MKLRILNRDSPEIQLANYIVSPPYSPAADRGNNILHINTKNNHYSNNPSAARFVREQLLPGEAIAFDNDSGTLRFAVETAMERNSSGLFLEFGFCTGTTLNFIAALAYNRWVYGFDSLQGLPTAWRPGFPPQIFAYKDASRFPFIPLANVSLVIGWINDTLPVFRDQYLQEDGLAFIHIDSDTYESAHQIYTALARHIIPERTVIILDEGYNFSNPETEDGDKEWMLHEYSATNEFAQQQGYQIRYLGFNSNHQQLVLTFAQQP